jgi:signal peptidase II
MLIFAIVCILALVGIDQAIKFWAIDNLKGAESLEFIKFGDLKVINLTYLENDGAVFGSFSGQRVMLIAVSVIMVLVLGYFLIKHRHDSKLLETSLTLIIGGGIGNAIDRIFRGGRVVDFIEVKLFNFAIFNFADMCVVVGTLLLLLYVILSEVKEVKQSKGEDSN